MDRAKLSRRTGRAARPSSVHADRLEYRFLMASFVVTTTADSGPGSLREAIELANLSPTSDDVRFNIPGEGWYRSIVPLTPLPAIAAPLLIDATTQPGYVRSPVVELNGQAAGLGANGLTVSAPQSTIRGLAINRFAGHGIVATGPVPAGPGTPALPGGTGLRVEMNYVGTDVTGTVDLGNGGAGVVVSAAGVVVGAAPTGTATPVGRNVISGNGFAGVWVVAPAGQSVSSVNLPGNLIGTNAAGNRALGNDREGVLVEGNVNAVTIGGPMTTGQFRNVISGNAASGIRVTGQTFGFITIEGNLIGTDATGASALGNGRSALLPYRDGVSVAAGAMRIGGTVASSRNVISANGGAGVAIYGGTDIQVAGNFIGTDYTGNSALGNRTDGVAVTGPQTLARVTGNVVSGNGANGVRLARVQRTPQLAGNYIGTNASGIAGLGNGDDGVEVDNIAATVTIGGPSSTVTPPPIINPAAVGRNVISANGGHGVNVFSDPAATGGRPPLTIIGNFIGADVSGSVPLGNAGSGVYVATTGVTVGGANSSTAERNVIAANGGNGVTIVGPAVLQTVSPVGNVVQGNLIGAGLPRVGNLADLTTDTGMGNAGNGVAIYYSASNRVGGPSTASGNSIVFNGGNGVLVQGSLGPAVPTTDSAEGNVINSNAIYGNGKLGIDLASAGEGVTPNDPRDADSGPNRLQNHPVITEAVAPSTTGTGSATIRFTLQSEPGKTYRVDFFASVAPDASGRGEGQAFMGFTNVTTDASGVASGTFAGTFNLPLGQRLPPAAPIVPFFSATATEGGRNTSEFSPAVRAVPSSPPGQIFVAGAARVVGRHAFYGNSAFDLAGGDDAAVAADKRALLPGETPSFANVTSYGRGLTGVMVDVSHLPVGVVLTPDEYLARPAGSPGGQFAPAPAPYAVAVRRGAGEGGSDRVTLYWADDPADPVGAAVRNGWLQVTVLANAVTGLAAPDVFYFGNLVGSTGVPDPGTAGGFRVNYIDFARTRAASAAGQPAPVTSRFDHDRDGDVDADDQALVRLNFAARLDPFAADPVFVAASAATRYRPTRPRPAEELSL
jgi:hypothetical protein